MDNNMSKKWYKSTWGVIVAVLFFPIFLIWYAWSESNWSKEFKIGMTVAMSFILLVSLAITPQETQNPPGEDSSSVALEQANEVSEAELQDDVIDNIQEQNATNDENETDVQDIEPGPETAPDPIENTVSLTNAQKNAIRSANSYIDFSGFSRQGLIDQLSSEFSDQYAVADATIAVDSLDINYNEQAARSAQSYLDFSGYSCQGLIDQLSSEFGDQYTVEQARSGAEAVGAC